MGRNTNYSQRQSSASRSKEPHFIWRGIGCLMILIVPAISIIAGNATIDYAIANKWAIPQQLKLGITLPEYFYATSGLRTIFEPLGLISYGQITASLVYMILIGGLISVGYAIIYRFVGPDRYGETDAPPIKVKINKKTR